MTVGASTANLYPALTEDALDQLLELGFRDLEVFVNTESELEPSFIAMLREKAARREARILAMPSLYLRNGAVSSFFAV